MTDKNALGRMTVRNALGRMTIRNALGQMTPKCLGRMTPKCLGRDDSEMPWAGCLMIQSQNSDCLENPSKKFRLS